MKPKLFMFHGRPFVATDEAQCFVDGKPQTVLAGFRPEHDKALGSAVLRSVVNVRPADCSEASAEAHLAALLRAFGRGEVDVALPPPPAPEPVDAPSEGA